MQQTVFVLKKKSSIWALQACWRLSLQAKCISNWNIFLSINWQKTPHSKLMQSWIPYLAAFIPPRPPHTLLPNFCQDTKGVKMARAFGELTHLSNLKLQSRRCWFGGSDADFVIHARSFFVRPTECGRCKANWELLFKMKYWPTPDDLKSIIGTKLTVTGPSVSCNITYFLSIRALNWVDGVTLGKEHHIASHCKYVSHVLIWL